MRGRGMGDKADKMDKVLEAEIYWHGESVQLDLKW